VRAACEPFQVELHSRRQSCARASMRDGVPHRRDHGTKQWPPVWRALAAVIPIVCVDPLPAIAQLRCTSCASLFVQGRRSTVSLVEWSLWYATLLPVQLLSRD
jgi:hypothetical protein